MDSEFVVRDGTGGRCIMPTYPFFCRDCRKPFEVVKPVGAKTAQCPHCKGKNTERIWSTVSVKTSKKS